jgi:hypothetical protein
VVLALALSVLAGAGSAASLGDDVAAKSGGSN